MRNLARTLAVWTAVAAPGLAWGHGSTADRAARLDHAVEAAPNDRDALVARAELALELGSPRGAIADLERVAALDGHGPGPSATARQGRELLLARAYLAAGDAAAASVVIASVLEATPAEPRALYLRARLISGAQQHAAAAIDLERSIANTKEPAPSAYLELCKLHVVAGDDERALGVLVSAAERFGPLAVIVDAAIDIERRRERFREALFWHDRSEERLRVSPAGRARRAELLAALGRWSDAEEEAKLGLVAVESLPPARKSSAAMLKAQARLQATVDAAGAQPPSPVAESGLEGRGPGGSFSALALGAGLLLLLASAVRRSLRLSQRQA